MPCNCGIGILFVFSLALWPNIPLGRGHPRIQPRGYMVCSPIKKPALFSHFEWWDLASVSTCYRITHPIWRKNLLHQPLFPGCTFAAQDHGDLREHLAAVVISSHFHGWEIFTPNGTVGLLWQTFPT